jgi:polyferredoxin
MNHWNTKNGAMMKNRVTAFFENWKRRLVQIVSLSVIGEWSFYGIFRCPFAVPYVGCGNCPVVQCPGIHLWMWAWIAIGVSAVAFGRVFCGFACPGYLVSEIVSVGSFLGNKVKGMFRTILGFGRYIVLAAALYFTFAAANPRWAVPIRTGEFFNAVSLTFEHAQPYWIYRTVFVLAAVALSIAVPMFWCRFLCPTGGALELLSRFSIFKYAMNNACTDCGKCAERCPMETRPSEFNCTNCGDCVSSCGPKAIEIKGPAIP